MVFRSSETIVSHAGGMTVLSRITVDLDVRDGHRANLASSILKTAQ